MIKISRHEIVKDGAGKITKLIIGVTYTDDISGKSSYRDTVFLAKDFAGTPTKKDVLDKFRRWLSSTLQSMKDETVIKETTIVLKQGDTNSLVGEAVPEVQEV